MRIGILTGSGTYTLPELAAGGIEIVHISRHEEGHRLLSSQVDHRANITGLAEAGVDAILAVTVCGACDPEMELGTLVVFDDLFFPSNRLPDGSLCTLHTEPGAPGRGHWIFDRPFSEPLRGALLAGARAAGRPVRDGGVYGHVDGPRFNTRSEIAWLMSAGVTCVSQTAGPETVLAGEAKIPYALLGYATDYANGVKPEEPTPVEELVRLVGESSGAFAEVLAASLPLLADLPLEPNGTAFSWD